MAENKTILELNEVTANASGDTFVVVQGGVTQKTTLSKIKTFFDAIYTTTSAVASQISSALTNYATQTFATQAANTAAETRIPKQGVDVVAINASTTSSLNNNNCILSITNIPSGSGNKKITMRVIDDVLTIDDIISTSLIYDGFDVNLRSWAITIENDLTYLELFINIHSSPTEPVLIAINKIN